MDYLKYKNRRFLHILVIPVIWTVFIPLLILDLFLEIYHNLGFSIYGLEKIERHKYIKIDRYKLKYLNLFQKLNCLYCGYANGFLHYALAIAGTTEKYWCGIKHNQNNDFEEPEHHGNFTKYGDKQSYSDRYEKEEPSEQLKYNK